MEYTLLVMTEEFLYYGTFFIKNSRWNIRKKTFAPTATAIKDFDSVNYKHKSPSKFPVYDTK